MHDDRSLYESLLLIRQTEEMALRLFEQGRVSGTTHACIGQEANAVGIIGQLDPARDMVISNHRCHGHFLAFGGSVRGLLGEIMGLDSGVCGGLGGSQHIRHGGFFSNGIQGGGAPIACGLAMAAKRRGETGALVALCMGDGTLGQGVVYESFNMASLWELPILFLLEDNGWAQSTPRSGGVAGDIPARAGAFGIETREIESTDVRELFDFGREAIAFVRETGRPLCAVVHTCRLCAHSKSDDSRPKEVVECLWESDPLRLQEARLSPEEAADARSTVDARVADALAALRPEGGRI